MKRSAIYWRPPARCGASPVLAAGADHLWVKVCGTTSLADAQLAVDAGADALGFVLAEGSPRRVTPQQAGVIASGLGERVALVERVGVFVSATAGEIAWAVEAGRFTGVQLHGEFDPKLVTALRQTLGPRVKLLQVIHFQRQLAQSLQQLAESPVATAIDGVLVDSRTASAAGGTGVRFDWEAARQALEQAGTSLRVIVAGGLDAENVGEAVRVLRPAGVDVVSGVEQAPGRKDPARVRAFVAAARKLS